jgi:hypothetical protein
LALIGSVTCDLGTELLIVSEPERAHFGRGVMISQRLFEQAQAPIELPAHDRMRLMSFGKGTPFVAVGTAEVPAGELEFELLEALFVDLAKKEANHHVSGHALDKIIDNCA